MGKSEKQEPQRRNLSLPHSREAELAVIGGILFTPEAAQDVVDKLIPDHYYLPLHKLIVQAIVEVVQNGVRPDVIAVAEHLRKTSPDFDPANLEQLSSLMSYGVDASNLMHYISSVKHYFELRTIVDVCHDVVVRGRQVTGADVGGFLQEVESKFMQISENRITSGLRPSMEIVQETIHELEKILDNPPGAVTGVASGFTDLDKVTSGFQRSDLIIIGARPAMGKTALALNIALHAALKDEKYVAFFSLEMSSKQLMQRLLAMTAGIEGTKFRAGNMDANDLEKLYAIIREFMTNRLSIDDTGGISLLELASRCRKLKRERGRLDLVVVDYLQLMTAGPGLKNAQSREREVSYISWGLKNLAKELECSVLSLAQLGRQVENDKDKRPKPHHLRESGSIEQDADQIMFLYRDEVYNENSPDKGLAEILIRKNRHGPNEITVKVAFDKKYGRFHNLARVPEP